MIGSPLRARFTRQQAARLALRASMLSLAVLASSGCRRGKSASELAPDAASVPVAVSCAAAQTPTAPVSGVPVPRALPVGTLVLTLTTQPPARPASEATVRIEGETSRSTVKVDPRLPARFELAPGLYDLRVALDGYASLSVRVTLSAGCTAEVTPTLRGRSPEKQ